MDDRHGPFDHIESYEKTPCDAIDWEGQWKDFAPNFTNGQARIRGDHFDEVLLSSGKGFGDLSHPTTRLMLKLMGPSLKGKTVIDMGCGSGILSLAAAKMGAEKVYGIDIDEEAVIHAKKNCALNGLEEKISISNHLPRAIALQKPIVILMNMIFLEQKIVREHYRSLFSSAETLIASGLLSNQKNTYLDWIQPWNLEMLHEEEGWLVLQLRNSVTNTRKLFKWSDRRVM